MFEEHSYLARRFVEGLASEIDGVHEYVEVKKANIYLWGYRYNQITNLVSIMRFA
jgi:hypothetical protein